MFVLLCFHRPPVGDVLLLPLGLSVEEVVVGHIWDAAAGLLHDPHGVGVDLSRLWKREKLLHLLQGVLEHHEVASVLWAAIELIQIVLKEEQTHEGRDVYSVLELLVAQTLCGTHQRHFFVRPGGVVSGKPNDRRRGSVRCFPGDKVQQKDVDNQPTAAQYRRKSHFVTSCSRFVPPASPLCCFTLLNFPLSLLLNGASCTSTLQSFPVGAALLLLLLTPHSPVRRLLVAERGAAEATVGAQDNLMFTHSSDSLRKTDSQTGDEMEEICLENNIIINNVFAKQRCIVA